MSLNESIVEDAMILPAATLTRPLPRGEGKKLGVGRVKFRGPFPISLFTLHSSSPRTLATLRDPATAGLPKLLSGELSVEDRLVTPSTNP